MQAGREDEQLILTCKGADTKFIKIQAVETATKLVQKTKITAQNMKRRHKEPCKYMQKKALLDKREDFENLFAQLAREHIKL